GGVELQAARHALVSRYPQSIVGRVAIAHTLIHRVRQRGERLDRTRRRDSLEWSGAAAPESKKLIDDVVNLQVRPLVSAVAVHERHAATYLLLDVKVPRLDIGVLEIGINKSQRQILSYDRGVEVGPNGRKR